MQRQLSTALVMERQMRNCAMALNDVDGIWVKVAVMSFEIKMSEKSGTNVNCIYYLHYMLYMFTLTLYAFSQPLYRVCADFSQHIGIDSSTTVCNSLPKVTKTSDFNSIHHPRLPLSTISTLPSNVNAIFGLLTFKFNL
jgi:hypothetical protein